MAGQIQEERLGEWSPIVENRLLSWDWSKVVVAIKYFDLNSLSAYTTIFTSDELLEPSSPVSKSRDHFVVTYFPLPLYSETPEMNRWRYYLTREVHCNRHDRRCTGCAHNIFTDMLLNQNWVFSGPVDKPRIKSSCLFHESQWRRSIQEAAWSKIKTSSTTRRFSETQCVIWCYQASPAPPMEAKSTTNKSTLTPHPPDRQIELLHNIRPPKWT
jgi:hypothetical protein